MKPKPDKKLLAEFRSSRFCEYCMWATPHGCEPHHLRTKGAGYGDLRANLIAICRYCHQKFHDGNLKYEELLLIVALRERLSPAAIHQAMDDIWILPKDDEAGMRRVLERLYAEAPKPFLERKTQ